MSHSLFQAEKNDPEFAKNVKEREGMLRVRERSSDTSRSASLGARCSSLPEQAKRACAAESDLHDLVSECGSGKTALKNAVSEVGASQAGKIQLRSMMKDDFGTNKRGLDDGMEGVCSALGVLRGHSEGAETAHETVQVTTGESKNHGLA